MRLLLKYFIILFIFFGMPLLLLGDSIARDPFEVIVYRTAASPLPGKNSAAIVQNRNLVLKLSGILKEGKHSQAIISVGGISSVFDRNDRILDITVIGISDTQVLLQRKGKTYILEIGKDLTL